MPRKTLIALALAVPLLALAGCAAAPPERPPTAIDAAAAEFGRMVDRLGRSRLDPD